MGGPWGGSHNGNYCSECGVSYASMGNGGGHKTGCSDAPKPEPKLTKAEHDRQLAELYRGSAFARELIDQGLIDPWTP